MSFAYLDLDLPENPLWYEQLLSSSLGRQVEIANWKRCAGTVLAVNGYRDYYCLYHPQYRSISTVGRFAGLDDDDDDENSPQSSNDHDPQKMLQRLPQWLDALLEGTLKRFRVEHWPEMQQIVDDLNHTTNIEPLNDEE